MLAYINWHSVTANTAFLETHIPCLPPVIERFELTNVRFESPECVKIFTDALIGRIIHVLHIDNCVITQNQIYMLIHMLNQMNTHTLTLTNLDLPDAVCEHISEFGESLRHLALPRNKLTCKGVCAIAHMRLDSLDISQNAFTRKFTHWRSLITNIKMLRIANCFATKEEFYSACDSIDGITCTLQGIDLSSSNLTVYELARLFHALRFAKIRDLCLTNNYLNDEALLIVAQCKRIKHAFLDFNTGFSSQGALKASSAFKRNANLRHLSMSNCGLPPNIVKLYTALNDDHRRMRSDALMEIEDMLDIRDVAEDACLLL